MGLPGAGGAGVGGAEAGGTMGCGGGWRGLEVAQGKGCDGGTGTELGTRGGPGFVPGVERLGGEKQLDSEQCALPSYSLCVTKKAFIFLP